MSGRVLAFPSRVNRHADRSKRAADSPQHRVVERGIWLAPALEGDCEAVIAVDSRHRRIASVTLYEGFDLGAVRAALLALLDAVDPCHPREVV